MKKISIAIGITALLVLVVSVIILININSPAPAPTISVNSTDIEKIVYANNQFALEMYSGYKFGKDNVFYSPYSISSALAMTYEGARGSTAEEMQKVFHFPENLKEPFYAVYSELNAKDKPYMLRTANALWAQKDYKFLPEYFQLIESYYGGKVTNLDFKTETEKSRETINDWIEAQTNDKIKDIIAPGDISPLTRLVLTNAIYFKGKWESQFKKENTFDNDFTLDSEENVTVPMMHQTDLFRYGESDKLQILEMPYEGNNISMIIFLPKNNELGYLEATLNIDNINEARDKMIKEEVRISIPKFKFETRYLLAETLAKMGMPTAFNPYEANFSGMDGTNNLYIDKVIHQAYVAVDEEGTEAAAATVVTMELTSIGPQETKIFNADHPFMFIIQDVKTGNILFLGKVMNPLE